MNLKLNNNKMNIKLNKNFKIKTDSVHGFILLYESDSYEKKVNTKEGVELKMVTTKDLWYYPKLSQVLEKFMSLNVMEASDVETLYDKILEVEGVVKNFDKVFAKKGEVMSL